jgi:hypothetical protein
MKSITDYKIYESKGTPDIIREILNENSSKIKEILVNKNTTVLSLLVNKSQNINKKLIHLKCNLNIWFNFIDLDSYNGNIKFEDCIKSNFEDCEINIFIPKSNIDKLRVYKSLSHELTHLYELYQIKDVFDKSSWVKSKKLNIFDNLKLNDGLIRYFRDIFYSSLPHEIRANLSSLEVYLIGLNSKDQSYIRNELGKTSEWSRYKAISDFNTDRYIDDLISRYNESFTIRIFNIFNEILGIEYQIKNINDLKIYFNKWKKYFTKISNEYKRKIDSKIKEILESEYKLDKYIIEEYEDKILLYSDYLNDISYERDVKIDEILKIDYLSFFI